MFAWFRKHVRKIGLFGVEVEFHPPADAVAHTPPTPLANPVGTVGGSMASSHPTPVGVGPSPDGQIEKTFDEVIRAIREHHPDAPLGATAERGQYFERAKHLTNYRMYEDNPLCYVASQANGRMMWLYLGRGGKICCGDKE